LKKYIILSELECTSVQVMHVIKGAGGQKEMMMMNTEKVNPLHTTCQLDQSA
jgi:hypothetical protein